MALFEDFVVYIYRFENEIFHNIFLLEYT